MLNVYQKILSNIVLEENTVQYTPVLRFKLVHELLNTTYYHVTVVLRTYKGASP